MIAEALFCLAIQNHRVVWQKLDKPQPYGTPCLIYNANWVPILAGKAGECPANQSICQTSKKAHDK